jgi:protein-tyrosine phosphatase
MEQDEADHGDRPFVSYENWMSELAADENAAITFDRFSIPDCDIPTGINMNRIFNQIDENIQAGKPVFIHCWGGRGRTGTVVGCWMVSHGMVYGREAVDRIQHLRRNTFNADQPSPETLPQIQMVETWG